METKFLSDPNIIRSYILGSMYFSACRYQNETHLLNEALNWYNILLRDEICNPPFFIIFDLGHLLLWGTNFPFQHSLTNHLPDEIRLREIYENRILNFLLRHNKFRYIMELLENYRENKDAIITHTLSLLLKPLIDNKLWHIFPNYGNLPQLQQIYHTAFDIERKEFETLIGEENFFINLLEQFVNNFMEHIDPTLLFQEEDFFELEHIHLFSNKSIRKTNKYIKMVARKTGNYDKRYLHIHPEQNEIETELQYEGFYPEGGLSELTNRGSFENLVSSELIYLDASERIDWFVLRYLERELLFYKRDSGLLRKRRRNFNFILWEANFKPSNLPCKLSSLMKGFGLSLIENLFDLFSDDELHIDYYILKYREDNIETLQLLLANKIERNKVILKEYSQSQEDIKKLLEELNNKDLSYSNIFFFSASNYEQIRELSSNIKGDHFSVIISHPSATSMEKELILDFSGLEPWDEILKQSRDQLLRLILN